DQAGARPAGPGLDRPSLRPRLRRQRVERVLPGRGVAARGGLRPLVRLVLRGRRPRLPAPVGGLRLRVRPGLPDPPRRLGQLRPRPPRAPAADVAQRRDPLLDRPAETLAAPGGRPPPGVHGRPGPLAAGARPGAAVPARQARRLEAAPDPPHPPPPPRRPGDAGVGPAPLPHQARPVRGHPQPPAAAPRGLVAPGWGALRTLKPAPSASERSLAVSADPAQRVVIYCHMGDTSPG